MSSCPSSNFIFVRKAHFPRRINNEGYYHDEINDTNDENDSGFSPNKNSCANDLNRQKKFF